MKAVVVAAGRGTRMGPLTDERPKPLLPIAGTPIVEHVLDTAAPYVDGFVVVVGYRAAQVKRQIGGTHRGIPVTYAEQAEQLGTAHAVAQAQPHVDEEFLVLNGDVHVTEQLVAALAVQPVKNPRAYGVVELDGERVTRIVEKPDDPPSNLANLGSYRLTPNVFEY